MCQVPLVGMTTILSNEDYISTIREVYFDRTRTIFLTEYVVDDEIDIGLQMS